MTEGSSQKRKNSPKRPRPCHPKTSTPTAPKSTKACHESYKFDSKAEKDFAFIVESEKAVIKWLRPAYGQFRIYWANNAKRYLPDFIVETDDHIYMVEIKAINEMDSEEVIEKMNAALEYCQYATEFTQEYGGKSWDYLLIPHTEATTTTSWEFLVNGFRRGVA